MKKTLLYFMLFVLSALNSFSSESKVSLGIAALSKEQPYKGVGSDEFLLPLIEVEYENLYFKKTELGYVALRSPSNSISFFLDFWDGYSVDGNDLSSGYDKIDDRESQSLGGVRMTYSPNYYYLYDTKLSAELGIGEKGNKLSFAISKPEMYFDYRLIVVPTLKLNLLNDKYTDYYFGIDSSEAASNASIGGAYEADRSHTLAATIAVQYLFDVFSVYAYAGIEYLGDEIKDSPIISDEFIHTIGTGVKYTF